MPAPYCPSDAAVEHETMHFTAPRRCLLSRRLTEGMAEEEVETTGLCSYYIELALQLVAWLLRGGEVLKIFRDRCHLITHEARHCLARKCMLFYLFLRLLISSIHENFVDSSSARLASQRISCRRYARHSRRNAA